MKIFILEDDSSCKGIIDWIRGNHDVVTAVDNIENASYFLEYQEEYRNYDKSRVCHLKTSNGAIAGSVFERKYAVSPIFYGFVKF